MEDYDVDKLDLDAPEIAREEEKQGRLQTFAMARHFRL